jgi:hypothetical protein
MERALLCTHHLLSWTGSEVFVIEIAEALSQAGFTVDFYTPFHDPEFAPAALPPHGKFFTEPEAVRLDGYDLVYVQHQTLSRLVPHQDQGFLLETDRPFFHFAHLSSVEPFELPGPWVEEHLADAVWTQSPKTLSEYRRRYPGRIAELAECVPNPAPEAFSRTTRPSHSGRLRRLLSVSNHLPAELKAAFEILQTSGVEIVRFGHPEANSRLVPSDFEDVDAVVTIGKTVQYALLACCPIFCYDHFGGPGWLSDENFEETAYRNFSGLTAPNRYDGPTLAERLLGGFVPAADFAANLPDALIAQYRLEPHVARLLDRVRAHKANPSPLPVARRPGHDSAVTRALWSREADLYGLVDREFGKAQTFRRVLLTLREKSAKRESALRDQNGKLKAQIEALQSRVPK